jgi:Ni/Co efflux regulator RcnB
MKTKFLTAGIIAALMVPAVASAQPHGNNNHDRARAEAVKQDQRHPLLRGNDRDQRPVVQQNSRNNRNDWRQDQRYRNFRAPFSYQRFQNGSTLRKSYYSSQYRPAWDNRWGVPRAKKNETYVRHYNDLLLVNDKNGKVVRVYRDMFRSR